MQRYDYSKKGLLDYYEIVNMEAARKYTEQLEHVSNDTMRELSTKESEELSDIIKSEQKMVNIGDDFRSWQKALKMFYTIEMIPSEAYDGIIILKETTPTDVID